MIPGSVFFDKDFHFHDGESSEKLFIVLGEDAGISIVVKTTSQPHGRGIQYGCQPHDRFHNFYLPQRTCYLKKCTWVCLDEFYELGNSELLQKKFGGVVNHVCDIAFPIIREIQDCAIASDDISNNHENIITSCLVTK